MKSTSAKLKMLIDRAVYCAECGEPGYKSEMRRIGRTEWATHYICQVCTVIANLEGNDATT